MLRYHYNEQKGYHIMISQNKRRGGGLTKLLFFLFLFVIVSPFILTSSFVVEGFVLPKIEESTGSKIAADIDISLLNSRIDLANISFEKKDELKLTADNISCVYDLSDLLSGVISIDKLELEDLDVVLSEKTASVEADSLKSESRNTQPLQKQAKKSSQSAALDLPDLNLNNITISDLSVRYKTLKGELIELKDFSLMLDQLKQGEQANLSYAGQINLNYGAAMMLSSDELEGSVKYAAGSDLLPENVEFITSLNNVNGSIQERGIKGNSLLFKLSVDRMGQAFLLRECSLKELSGSKVNSKLNLTGKVLSAPLSAKLNVEVLPISAEMLNLFGALSGGYSFEHSKLYYKGSVDYHSNQNAEVKGKLFVSNFAVALPHQGPIELPPMNLSLDYRVFADLQKKEFILSKMIFSGTHGQQKIVVVDLADEARVMYGDSKSRFSDTSPTITTKISGLGLSLVNQFVPDDVQLEVKSGALDLNSIVTIGQGGRVINAQTLANAKNLTVEHNGLSIEKLGVNTDISFSVTDMANFELQRAEVSLTKARKSMASFSARSKYNMDNHSGLVDLSVSLQNKEPVRDLISHFAEDSAVNEVVTMLSASALNADANFEFDMPAQTLKVNAAHISLREGERRILGLDNEEPFSVSLTNGDIASVPMGMKFSLDSFDLRNINPFLSAEQSVLSGKLSADVNVSKGHTMNVLSLGSINVSQLNFISDNKQYGAISARENFNIGLKNNSNLDIRSSKLDVEVNRVKCGSISLSGKYDIANESGDITAHIDGVNHNISRMSKSIPDLIPLKTFNFTGGCKVNLRQKPAKSSAVGKVIGRGLTFSRESGFNTSVSYNAGTSYNIEYNADELTLNNVKLQLQQGNEMILDSHASGKVATPVGSGRSALFVGADKVDLDKVLAIFEKKGAVSATSSKPRRTSRVASAKVVPGPKPEPAPVDLGGVNMRLELDLKNISYYGMDNGVKGELLIRNNTVQARPLVVSFDGAPVTVNSSIDLGAKQGYTYSLSANGKNINLSNAMAQVVGATKRKPSLVVSALGLDIKGKGVTVPSLEKHLNSTLNLAFEKISLPHEPNRKGASGTTFGFLFGILETAGSFVGMMPGHFASQVDDLTAYLNGKKNLEFSKGDLNLNVKDGKIYFDKVIFEGEDIDRLTLSGNIGLSRSVNVDATLDFGSFKMPLPISGTLDAPRFDRTLFMSRIVTAPVKKGKDLATDILKSPEKIYEIIEDKDKRDQIVDDLLGDFLNRKKRKKKAPQESVPQKAEPVEPAPQKEEPAPQKEEPAPQRRDPAQELIEDVLQNLF